MTGRHRKRRQWRPVSERARWTLTAAIAAVVVTTLAALAPGADAPAGTAPSGGPAATESPVQVRDDQSASGTPPVVVYTRPVPASQVDDLITTLHLPPEGRSWQALPTNYKRPTLSSALPSLSNPWPTASKTRPSAFTPATPDAQPAISPRCTTKPPDRADSPPKSGPPTSSPATSSPATSPTVVSPTPDPDPLDEPAEVTAP